MRVARVSKGGGVVEFKPGGVVDSGVSDGRLRVTLLRLWGRWSLAGHCQSGRDAELMVWGHAESDWSQALSPLHFPYRRLD